MVSVFSLNIWENNEYNNLGHAIDIKILQYMIKF